MSCCGSGCRSHRDVPGSEKGEESKPSSSIPLPVDQANVTPVSLPKQIIDNVIGNAGAHEPTNRSDGQSSHTKHPLQTQEQVMPSHESCSRSGLSCISDASAKQSRMSTTASGQKKRKARDDEPGTGGSEADAENSSDIFEFLAPSDLRLTPKALVETHISHFRCNVNGDI
jgi:hypothetical protein